MQPLEGVKVPEMATCLPRETGDMITETVQLRVQAQIQFLVD